MPLKLHSSPNIYTVTTATAVTQGFTLTTPTRVTQTFTLQLTLSCHYSYTSRPNIVTIRCSAKPVTQTFTLYPVTTTTPVIQTFTLTLSPITIFTPVSQTFTL